MTDVVVVGRMITDSTRRLASGLKGFGVHIVAESEQVSDVLTILDKRHPHVVVMDYAENAEKDLSLIRLIQAKNPQVKILLITHHTADELLLDGLTVGAKGYLEWEACGVFLAKAIEAIALGEAWLSRKMVAAMLSRLTQYAEQHHVQGTIPTHPDSSGLIH